MHDRRHHYHLIWRYQLEHQLSQHELWHDRRGKAQSFRAPWDARQGKRGEATSVLERIAYFEAQLDEETEDDMFRALVKAIFADVDVDIKGKVEWVVKSIPIGLQVDSE